MPITTQCRSCAARYKIVDSAAGRRVKCRRCGKQMTVPGGAADRPEPALDLRAIAELERTGQLVAGAPDAEYQQYQAAVATVAQEKEAKANVKKDYKSINDVATPEARRKFATDGAVSKGSGSGSYVALAFLGAAGLAVVPVFVPTFLIINYVIGAAVVLCGKAWGTVVAFQESATAGTMYLVVPFYGYYYRKTRREQMKAPMAVTFIGGMIIALTLVALKYGKTMKGGS